MDESIEFNAEEQKEIEKAVNLFRKALEELDTVVGDSQHNPVLKAYNEES